MVNVSKDGPDYPAVVRDAGDLLSDTVTSARSAEWGSATRVPRGECTYVTDYSRRSNDFDAVNRGTITTMLEPRERVVARDPSETPETFYSRRVTAAT